MLALLSCGGEEQGLPGPDGARRGVVEAVSDGDTVRLRGLDRVRLIGIDTPEVADRAECFGPEASAYVARQLPPGTVVGYRLGRDERDRFGRPLAYVWLPDGRFLNGLLVERGYARTLSIAPNTDYAGLLARAAARAREARLGLWGKACRSSGG